MSYDDLLEGAEKEKALLTSFALSFLLSCSPEQLGSRPTKKPLAFAKGFFLFVGKTRFELATPCTPYKCATGLRHFPNKRVAKIRHNFLL